MFFLIIALIYKVWFFIFTNAEHNLSKDVDVDEWSRSGVGRVISKCRTCLWLPLAGTPRKLKIVYSFLWQQKLNFLNFYAVSWLHIESHVQKAIALSDSVTSPCSGKPWVEQILKIRYDGYLRPNKKLLKQ